MPTRELALQTAQICKELGKHLKVQVMTSTGGTSIQDEIMRLYETGKDEGMKRRKGVRVCLASHRRFCLAALSLSCAFYSNC